MADAFQTPAVRLGIPHEHQGVRLGLRPAAYFEWWAGETPPHDVKWDGMPLAPHHREARDRAPLGGVVPGARPRFTDPAVAALAPRIIEEAEDWIVIEKPLGASPSRARWGFPTR